jgi:hypothetical protein
LKTCRMIEPEMLNLWLLFFGNFSQPQVHARPTFSQITYWTSLVF